MKKAILLIALVVSVFYTSCSSDDDNSGEVESLVGVWRLTSLTENGEEILQEELEDEGICFLDVVFSSTTVQTIFYTGDDCMTENEGGLENYTLVNSEILIEGEDDGLEILQLSATTLRVRDAYMEEGIEYIDIYTYTKQ